MEVLYLSSLCSKKEYERIFNKYGSISSHASQKFNRLFVRGLIENGCTVFALTERILNTKDKDELKRPDEEEDGVYYKYLPRVKGKLTNKLYTTISAFINILKWQRAHKNGIIICDTILGEISIAVFLASLFKPFFKIAIVTDVPIIRAGDQRKGIQAIPVYIKNALIHSFDSFVFLTEQMNKLLNPKKKPYVIIEGFADDAVTNTPNNIENKYPQKVILMAGLLEKIFGVDDLINAFMQIKDAHAKLKFYGKGSSVESIKKAAEIDSRIEYGGELTNQQIVEEEKKATLLINPRPPVGEWTAYSFPSKNMEYMASGTPLVAYDLPCIPEEYKNYFFEIPDDENGIVNILSNLISWDSENLHEFGLKSQQWIVKNKNPKKQTEKLIEMIKTAQNNYFVAA